MAASLHLTSKGKNKLPLACLAASVWPFRQLHPETPGEQRRSPRGAHLASQTELCTWHRSKGTNAKMAARPALEIWGFRALLRLGRLISPGFVIFCRRRRLPGGRKGGENSRRIDPSSLNSTNLNGRSSSS